MKLVYYFHNMNDLAKIGIVSGPIFLIITFAFFFYLHYKGEKEEEEEENKKGNKLVLIYKLINAVFSIIVVSYFIPLAVNEISDFVNGYMYVPNIINMTRKDAEIFLHNLGFETEIKEQYQKN